MINMKPLIILFHLRVVKRRLIIYNQEFKNSKTTYDILPKELKYFIGGYLYQGLYFNLLGKVINSYQDILFFYHCLREWTYNAHPHCEKAKGRFWLSLLQMVVGGLRQTFDIDHISSLIIWHHRVQLANKNLLMQPKQQELQILYISHICLHIFLSRHRCFLLRIKFLIVELKLIFYR